MCVCALISTSVFFSSVFFFFYSLILMFKLRGCLAIKQQGKKKNKNFFFVDILFMYTNRIKCSATTHMLLIEPACAACNRALKSFEPVSGSVVGSKVQFKSTDFDAHLFNRNWKRLFARVSYAILFLSWYFFYWRFSLCSSSVNISGDYSIEQIQDNESFGIEKKGVVALCAAKTIKSVFLWSLTL